MVLVVDKDRHFCDCYTDFFSGLGERVLSVGSSHAALAAFLLNQQDLRLVITELSLLKSYDGLALARIIKKDSGLPVILITHQSLPDFGRKAFDLVLDKLTAFDHLDTFVRPLLKVNKNQ